MNPHDEYYAVLGLKPGASLAEIRQAYRDLSFVWHPDRMPSQNERLRIKAAERFKEITHAYESLQAYVEHGGRPTPQPLGARPTAPASRLRSREFRLASSPIYPFLAMGCGLGATLWLVFLEANTLAALLPGGTRLFEWVYTSGGVLFLGLGLFFVDKSGRPALVVNRRGIIYQGFLNLAQQFIPWDAIIRVRQLRGFLNLDYLVIDYRRGRGQDRVSLCLSYGQGYVPSGQVIRSIETFSEQRVRFSRY